MALIFPLVACSTHAPPGGQEVLGGRQRQGINPTEMPRVGSNDRAIAQLEGQLAQVQHDLRAWQWGATQAASPSTVPVPVPVQTIPIGALPPLMQAIELTQAPPSKPLAKPLKPMPAPHAPLSASKPEQGVTLGFAPASSHWSPPAQQVPAWLVAVKAAQHIQLVGSSKASGSSAGNKQLALARAMAVRDYLIGMGVSPHRMTLDTRLMQETAIKGAPDAKASRQVWLSWQP